jgi:hypothetical protein
MSELELCQQLVQVQDQIYPQSMTFPKWRNRNLTLKEIEHALCEFSKYRRVERGQ